jgi:hypothetical protein
LLGGASSFQLSIVQILSFFWCLVGFLVSLRRNYALELQMASKIFVTSVCVGLQGVCQMGTQGTFPSFTS